jgi:hypothetical protein
MRVSLIAARLMAGHLFGRFLAGNEELEIIAGKDVEGRARVIRVLFEDGARTSTTLGSTRGGSSAHAAMRTGESLPARLAARARCGSQAVNEPDRLRLRLGGRNRRRVHRPGDRALDYREAPFASAYYFAPIDPLIRCRIGSSNASVPWARA